MWTTRSTSYDRYPRPTVQQMRSLLVDCDILTPEEAASATDQEIIEFYNLRREEIRQAIRSKGGQL